MTIRFVDEAQGEFLDAISHYEEARGGLGRRFKDEVDRCVLWIADHPELYRLQPGGYRRINLRVFPYYMPYVIRGDALGTRRGSCQPQAALLDFPAEGNCPLRSRPPIRRFPHPTLLKT